ncbi:MAG TPA: hypothetical protein DCK95_06190 [Anaerolineaceae bacterium]|nr:hypothetical protein [Anaerolineaceae bacterium]
MESTLGHLQINIDLNNLDFYRSLFSFLGWKQLCFDARMLGLGDGKGSSLWFTEPLVKTNNHYDGIGMNHLAVSVKSQEDVDRMATFLRDKKIELLFDTPRHRPEFCENQQETYYQVMFLSPDNILLEVVYTGPLQLH